MPLLQSAEKWSGSATEELVVVTWLAVGCSPIRMVQTGFLTAPTGQAEMYRIEFDIRRLGTNVSFIPEYGHIHQSYTGRNEAYINVS